MRTMLVILKRNNKKSWMQRLEKFPWDSTVPIDCTMPWSIHLSRLPWKTWSGIKANRIKVFALITPYAILIKNWREDWQQDDFPFYYVQIAPFDWGITRVCPLVRDAQRKSLKVTIQVWLSPWILEILMIFIREIKGTWVIDLLYGHSKKLWTIKSHLFSLCTSPCQSKEKKLSSVLIIW